MEYLDKGGRSQVIDINNAAALAGTQALQLSFGFIKQGQKRRIRRGLRTWCARILAHIPAAGPGAVEFGNAGSPVTTASFSTGGVYILRLTATDGARISRDRVVVTVSEEPFAVSLPVSGLMLWVKADAGTRPRRGRVKVWADQSGSGNDFCSSRWFKPMKVYWGSV